MARPRTDPSKTTKAIELVDAGERPEDAARIAGVSHSVLKRALRDRPAKPPPPLPVPDLEAPPPRRSRTSDPELPSAPGHRIRFGADDEPDPLPPFVIADDADPLDIARAYLHRTTQQIALLPADSPRINPARAEARGLIKLVATLEQARGAVPTPEELELKRRREDADTRARIERYVLEYETEAAMPREGAPFGVCTHCGAARAAP